jgi:hypothetical protein
MADSQDFKIEEKIKAIKETMQRLGVSIKSEQQDMEGFVTSRSVEEVEVAGDLLMDTWEARQRPRTDMMAVRLSDVLTSGQGSQEFKLEEGKEVGRFEQSHLILEEKITELEGLIASQRGIIEQFTSERQEMKSIVRAGSEKVAILEKQLDQMHRDWEGLLEKCKALDAYCKQLETREDLLPAEGDSKHFQLLVEHAEQTQMLKIKEEELELVKNTLKQLRESMKEKDKVIAELRNAQKGVFALEKPSEVSLLRTQVGKLTKELENRPTAEECQVKDKQIKLLLNEIGTLKAGTSRPGRSRSVGKLPVKRPLKRTRSHDGRKSGLPPLRLPSPTDHSSATTRRLAASPQQRAIKTLLGLLGSKDLATLLADARRVMQEHTEMHAFVTYAVGLIQEVSPPGAFAKPPNMQEMSGWMKRLVEEYLKLLKASQVLVQLRSLLHVRSSSDLPKATARLVSDLRELEDFLSSVKVLLVLRPEVAIPEVMEVLRDRITTNIGN